MYEPRLDAVIILHHVQEEESLIQINCIFFLGMIKN